MVQQIQHKFRFQTEPKFGIVELAIKIRSNESSYIEPITVLVD
jgi:hypothetical protein